MENVINTKVQMTEESLSCTIVFHLSFPSQLVVPVNLFYPLSYSCQQLILNFKFKLFLPTVDLKL